MRNTVKVLIALAACILVAGTALAANVTIDPATLNLGYMNVYEIPANGGGYLWGSGWGFGDLTAYYTGSNLTLGPNSIGDPAEYWYIGGGAAGHPGNKVMYADSYAQVDDGSLAGQEVVFTGTVLSNSLTTAHVALAFIRDFAPDFSSVVEQSIPLPVSGPFSISLATINDPARHVQYGFQMKGPDVWFTELAPFGSATIAPFEPTPTEATTWGKLKSLYR